MPLESCVYYLKKYSDFSTFLMMLYLTFMNALLLLNESPTRIPLSDDIKCLMTKKACILFFTGGVRSTKTQFSSVRAPCSFENVNHTFSASVRRSMVVSDEL